MSRGVFKSRNLISAAGGCLLAAVVAFAASDSSTNSQPTAPTAGKAALVAHPPSRQLAGLVLVDKGGVLRAHQVVRTDRGDGEITSGTFSPTLNQSIALARLPAGVAPGDTVRVLVRDRELAARVVKPPFARNGKSLVPPAP